MKINVITIFSIFGIIGVLYLYGKAPKKLDDVSYAEGYVLHISYGIVTLSTDSTKEVVNILNTLYDNSIKLSSDSLIKIGNQIKYDENLFEFEFDNQIISNIYHNIKSAGYAYLKIRYKSGLTGRTYRTKYINFYQIIINDKIVFDYDFSREFIYWLIMVLLPIIIGIWSLWNNKVKDDNLPNLKT